MKPAAVWFCLGSQTFHEKTLKLKYWHRQGTTKDGYKTRHKEALKSRCSKIKKVNTVEINTDL